MTKVRKQQVIGLAIGVVLLGLLGIVTLITSNDQNQKAAEQLSTPVVPSTTAFVPSADYQVPIFETKGKRTTIGITTASSDPAEVRRVFDNFHDKMQADVASGFDGFDVTIRCTPPAGKERGEILAEGQFARTPIGAVAVGLDSKDVIKFTPRAGAVCA